MPTLNPILVFFLTFGLVSSPVPMLSPAHAAPVSGRAPAAMSEELREILELLPPARKDETVSEVYYRLDPRLSPAERSGMAPFFMGQGMKKAPAVKLLENGVEFSSDGQKMRLEFEERSSGLVVRVQGRELAAKEITDPVLRMKALERIMKESSKPTGALLFFLMPEAQAFFETGTWVALGVAAVTIGVAVWLMVQKNKAAEVAAKAAQACTVQVPTCCAVNGTYIMHSTSCCQEIGGSGLGLAACPATASGATAPESSAVPINRQGQR